MFKQIYFGSDYSVLGRILYDFTLTFSEISYQIRRVEWDLGKSGGAGKNEAPGVGWGSWACSRSSFLASSSRPVTSMLSVLILSIVDV